MIPKSHTKTFTAPEMRAALLSLVRQAPIPAPMKAGAECLIGLMTAPDLERLLWTLGRNRWSLLNLMVTATKPLTPERALQLLSQLPEVSRPEGFPIHRADLAPKGRT